MKTNPDNQNLIPERTGNNEIFNVKGYPKYQPVEDVFKKFEDDEEPNPGDFSKPIDSKNDTFRIIDREDIKNDNSGLNIFIPSSELDDTQAAVRSEYEKYNSIG